MKMPKPTSEDWIPLVKSSVMDEASFIRLTLSEKSQYDHSPWVKIVIRPVLVKGKRRMQFSFFDARQDITKNYGPEELEDRLDQVLSIVFHKIDVQSRKGDLHVRINRKGQSLITRDKPPAGRQAPNLSHDRAKQRALAPESEDRFLQSIGIADAQGKVRPGMQAKFRQINEFLRVLEQVVGGNLPRERPLRIVDCGCGSAYLTFAAYHFLTTKRRARVQVTGVDVNEEMVSKNRALAESLGWTDIEFVTSTIADFQPADPPDIVLSLHACDTATDEAISRGIRWNARTILAAPCCQHELHHKLNVPVFRPIVRHGILRERLADIVTDAFRALVLRIMGYRTDVVEFVDPEHTAKNLLIRAERGPRPGHELSVREYEELKAFWDVTPAVEEMVGEDLKQHLPQ